MHCYVIVNDHIYIHAFTKIIRISFYVNDTIGKQVVKPRVNTTIGDEGKKNNDRRRSKRRGTSCTAADNR